MADLPLQGIRVIDTSTSYAGPTATMYLADAGADVIKVERPGGDDSRGWGPPFVENDSAWFHSANRNKRSIVLDLKTIEGREVLDTLIGSAHVFVENFNPAKLTSLGLDPAKVRARYPRLIYCALSGFGLDGPDAHLPGYDLIAQARSGLMSVTGEAGRQPQRMSTALCDVAAGMAAVAGILAALRRVERGGPGELVDVSLLDTGLALMAPRISSFLAGESEPAPSGSTDSVLAIYQAFDTADRPISIAIGSDAIWGRVCDVLGLSDLKANEELATNAGRRAQRVRIVQLMSEVLTRKPAAHWLKCFADAKVPSAEVAFLSDVVSDPQIISRGSIFALSTKEGGASEGSANSPGSVSYAVASPWRLVDTPSPRRSAPAVGADTQTILAEVGVSMSRVDELTDLGAFGKTASISSDAQ